MTMDEMTFNILKVALTLAVAVLTAYIIPYLKSKTSEATQQSIDKAILVAVQAAEQTIKGGAVKKEQVMHYMRKWLSQRGIGMTEDQLNILVEGVVYEIKKAKGV